MMRTRPSGPAGSSPVQLLNVQLLQISLPLTHCNTHWQIVHPLALIRVILKLHQKQ